MGSKFNSKVQLKKFKKHFWLGLLGTIVLILVLAFLSNPKEEKPQEKKAASSTFSAVKPLSVSNADVMSQRLEQYIQEQQKINEQNSKKIADLESQNQDYRQDKMEAESKAAAVNAKLATLNSAKANSSGVVKAPPPQKIVFEDDINSDNSDDGFEKSAKQAVSQQKTKADEDKSISTYIPSNSFVKGILIGSLSANTGGNASSEPTPFQIRLTDFAQLPNEFKSNLRSCFVGVIGWGDLSTERVKTRTTTLSCVLKSGKAIDIPIDGYVQGEDAKAGIAGVVVTHSGAIAAKATLAGFVQGIGQIGQAMGQTQTITPLGGVTTTISPSQAVQAGVGSGVSQAGSTLSQYYLNMLQQISPAIEVAGGRHVTVVFTKGVELKLPINNQDEANESPLPIAS